MLVLTRKSNQSIMIGDDIEISVLAVMGEKVRIGIEAPRSVPVFRREVYVEIQEESSDDDAEDLRDIDRELQGLRDTGLWASTGRCPVRRHAFASSAGEHRERLEHHHGHDDRGDDDRQREEGEAERALLAGALDAAYAGTLSGLLAEPLAAHDRLGRLLTEGLLELRE